VITASLFIVVVWATARRADSQAEAQVLQRYDAARYYTVPALAGPRAFIREHACRRPWRVLGRAPGGADGSVAFPCRCEQ